MTLTCDSCSVAETVASRDLADALRKVHEALNPGHRVKTEGR